MPDVNPDILRWARETAGLTPENAVKKLGIRNTRDAVAVDRLNSIEDGKDKPTRRLLEKMAKHYRRPLLIFYMPEIPRREDLGEDFRTLADPADQTNPGLVDAIVRDIWVRQNIVRATLESADEDEELSFVNSIKQDQGVTKVIESIKKNLLFDLKEFQKQPDRRAAFSYLRNLAEARGIFVILIDNLGSWHTKIDVKSLRGFALADSIAPFVAVNANDSPGAWSFTLAHELAHLWIGATGISGGTPEHKTEKFCNDVASEFLLPASEIEALNQTEETPFDDAKREISEFARDRNVSSTMVAYRIFRTGAFDIDRFQNLSAAYHKDFLENKKNKGKPNYYSVRAHRTGAHLVQLVERMMYDGNLSATKAGKILGVHANNVYKLVTHVRSAHAG